MNYTRILFPVDSIAQLAEEQSDYPKMQVRIPANSTFLVHFSSAGVSCYILF